MTVLVHCLIYPHWEMGKRTLQLFAGVEWLGRAEPTRWAWAKAAPYRFPGLLVSPWLSLTMRATSGKPASSAS